MSFKGMMTKSDPELSSARILVVEDDVLVRAVGAETLRLAGFTVIEATTADQAWAYLRTGEAVDLVFSDIQMPGSLTGVDLARLLRAIRPELPIILTSGRAGPEGLGRFLEKPYRPSELVPLVCELLGIEEPEW
jgi:CheY-like chemotaxis protein